MKRARLVAASAIIAGAVLLPVAQGAAASLSSTVHPSDASITLVNRGHAPVGQEFVIVGSLKFADGSSANAAHLTATRRSHGTTVPLVVASFVSAGSFRVFDTPTRLGRTVYTVRFAGDAQHHAAKASITVSVRRLDPALVVRPQVSTGGNAVVTATLVGGATNRVVTIKAQPAGGPSKVIAHGSVDALGNLAANYHVVKPTRFTVIYAGDGQYNKRHASASVLPTTVTPPVVLPPVEQRTTIAVENEIGALVSLRFSNELGNQTVVSHPGEIGDPFTLPNIPLPVNDIWMTVLAGADGGSTLTGGFFTPGHSYIVRVVWDPSSTHWVTLEQVAVS